MLNWERFLCVATPQLALQEIRWQGTKEWSDDT